MKRVGRPSLPYKTRHVMINMKDEHYELMKKGNINMSEIINSYLDERFHHKICPTCFGDQVDHRECAKCQGDAIFCRNEECNDFKLRVGHSCPVEIMWGVPRALCNPQEFYGNDYDHRIVD
jgi:hypothetical protein